MPCKRQRLKNLQRNAEKNLEEGFDGVLPVDRAIEEATILNITN